MTAHQPVNLDCYAYGAAVMARGRALGDALREIIGNRTNGDVVEPAEAE
jgi:hypothetical protein